MGVSWHPTSSLRGAEGDAAIQSYRLLTIFIRRHAMAIRMKRPAVYIMANRQNGALYTGMTSNLPVRVGQHRLGAIPGFTSRYGCKRLVWFEVHDNLESAILREKQIKAGSRKKKLALIEKFNPEWRDLFDDVAS